MQRDLRPSLLLDVHPRLPHPSVYLSASFLHFLAFLHFINEEAESQSDQIDDLPAGRELVTAASGPELLDPRLLTNPIPGA